LNRPSDGEYIEEKLEKGDLLLIASDGLFDNLYEDFIVEILNNHLVSFSFENQINIFEIKIVKDSQISVESLQNLCQMLVESACHGK